MRRQARWDLGLSQGAGETKDEVLSAYIQELRQNGLGGAADWDGLSRELEAFQSTTPEELEDGLDYLASRYVAVLDKLERNYTGGELAAQRAKLEEVYKAPILPPSSGRQVRRGRPRPPTPYRTWPLPGSLPRATGQKFSTHPPADGTRRRWPSTCRWRT